MFNFLTNFHVSSDFFKYRRYLDTNRRQLLSDWGRSVTYNRKRSGPRIEHCVTPYFNVPASEKTSIQTKNVVLGLKPFT